jgi:hypothetical protein
MVVPETNSVLNIPTIAFAEAMDHWSNINTAIDLLTGNLMWRAPQHVYTMSIKILNVIAKEATFSQAVPILDKLSTDQSNLRDAFEDDKMDDRQRMWPTSLS